MLMRGLDELIVDAERDVGVTVAEIGAASRFFHAPPTPTHAPVIYFHAPDTPIYMADNGTQVPLIPI